MITRESIRGSFPVKQLGDVADFLDNRRRPVKESDRKSGEYPYYGANGQQGTIDGYIFDEPLILLAEDGGFFDNPDRGIAYRISGKTWVNNHAHVLRPKRNVDLSYLCRVLENYNVEPFISGSTRAKLTKGQAEKIEIPLPPLEEQKRIAAILDQADDIRRKRQHAIDRLTQLGQAIFYEMFGDPASNPMGWEIGKIDDLTSSTQYGTSSKAGASGEYPILRMGNLLYSGAMDFTDLKYIDFPKSEVEKYTARSGDILFNRTNSPDLVGKTAVYYGDTPIGFAGYLVRLRVNDRAVPEFISAYLNSAYGKALLRGMCKAIVGMANINAKELRGIPIPLPPVDLQRSFQRKISALRENSASPTTQLTDLSKLFASLQHRAFTGQL